MRGRLAGTRVALVPLPPGLPAAIADWDAPRIARALDSLGLRAAYGWPHEDTADAMSAPDPDGTFLVVLSDEVVGDCGWKAPPGQDGSVEIGYGLAASARGRGLGTEAVGVLAAWAEQQPGVRLVTAEVLPGNEPSLRLLSRLGFHEQGSHPPYLRLVRPAPGAPRVRGRHVC